MSLPSREVWVEIVLFSGIPSIPVSLPSREVWVEIYMEPYIDEDGIVTSLTGSVG